MRNPTAPRTLLLALAVSLMGCIGQPAPVLESSSAGLVLPNGKRLNGKRLNGKRLNGKRLNGRDLNGSVFSSVRVELGRFVAVGTDGYGVAPEDIVGATFQTNTDGTEIRLTLEAVEESVEAGTHLLFFGYSEMDSSCDVENAPSSCWSWDVPLCDNGEGAIPIPAEWDETTGDRYDTDGALTLACRGYAIAKCVEMGYQAWSDVWTQDLRDHHQACTRMLRADYCGNGVSFTEDGTEVNVWDDLTPQRQSRDATGWAVEAAWMPGGATCLNHKRNEPVCYGYNCHSYGWWITQVCGETEPFQWGCGEDFWALSVPALLMNESYFKDYGGPAM